MQPPDTHFYQPRLGHRLPHDPFKSIIAPRPIGWISSLDPAGRPNLAPYSFFNAFAEDPPIIGFSSYSPKDSQRNIEATREFVFNLATFDLARQMNQTSGPYPHGANEFEIARLEPAPSTLVKPPRVAASPAALECKLTQIVPLLNLAGQPTHNTLILGQVVGVHIRPEFLANGLFDMTRAGTIARCGYRADYAHITELFKMPRPSGGA
jgi:flavin reductase (DIM6/NTAB) family NADH-FMN oxidoreductase RutF